MANDLKLFGDNFPANSPALEKLRERNKKLLGSGGTYRRISIKGGKFREIINGEQVTVHKEDELNVIVVDAAQVSRTYFEGAYDPNAESPVPPTCWSADCERPHESVPEEDRQSDLCIKCPMNEKGSGAGETRACRFGQRLAIVKESKQDAVYQMQLPSMSLFGKGRDGKYPMQAYARLLFENKLPVGAVVTAMSFDENSETPKVLFRPVRPLDEEEVDNAIALADSHEVKAALSMTVAQTDSGGDEPKKPAPKAKPKAKAKPKPKVEEEEDDEEEVEPPKKATRAKKAAAVPETSDDDDHDEVLGAIVGEWDDEDEDDED